MSLDRKISIAIAALMIVLLAGASAFGTTLKPRQLPVKPLQAKMLPGSNRNLIKVKFMDDREMVKATTGTPQDQAPSSRNFAQTESVLESITSAGGTWRRVTEGIERQADELRERAQSNLGQEIGRMNNYFNLYVPEGILATDWIDKLNALDIVELAYSPSLPAPLPIAPADHTSAQGYLDATTVGFDVEMAWNLWGGKGANVTICDLEYTWNLNHRDLSPGIQTLVPPGYLADVTLDDDHGTAVLGVLAGREVYSYWDGANKVSYLGVTGMVPDATITVGPTFLWDSGTGLTDVHIDAAIINALLSLTVGDVILIEQQIYGPNHGGSGSGQFGLVPAEWELANYNAIVTAVGVGVHVVEAAGNGSQNLDAPEYSTGNSNHWPFLAGNNSGAIIVGAGNVPLSFGGSNISRSRIWYSNYGSRVDVQGWGDRVMTTGYNLPDVGNTNPNDDYFDDFGGTSSGSATVAGAAALLESIHEGYFSGQVMSPAILRASLISNGAPQQSGTYPTSQHIGPLPDLLGSVREFGCGGNIWDSNNDGIVLAVSDLIQLIRYVRDNDMDRSTSWPTCGMEFNGYANPYFPCEPTLGDLLAFQRYFLYGLSQISNSCPGSIMPTVSPDLVIKFPPQFIKSSPPMFGRYTVQLENMSASTQYVWGVVVPLSLSLDLIGATNPVTTSFFVDSVQTYGIWADTVYNPTTSKPIVQLINASQPVVVPAFTTINLFDVNFSASSGSQGTLNSELYETPPGFFSAVYYSSTFPSPPSDGANMATTIIESILGTGDTPSGCCGLFTEGLTGNTDCDELGRRNLADITKLIDYVYISKEELCCEGNGNVDGDEFGKINLADITRLIDHVYISKAETAVCL